MNVVLSLLNWNSLVDTLSCLESIHLLADASLSICVTDNHSNTFDEKKIKEKMPSTVIFRNDDNLGFAAGHLQALNYAKNIKADLFWMLNNDLTVEKDSLYHLIEAYKKNGLGIYGSASLNKEGDLTQLDFWSIHPKKQTKSNFKLIDPKDLVVRPTVKVANVMGYSFLIPLEVIRRYGFMDTSFFLYYEETDYCLRMLEQTIPSYWVGKSVVYHKKEGAVKQYPELKETIEYYLYRNLFIFLKRHAPISLILHFLYRFMMRFLSANVASKTKVQRLTNKHLKGILHAFIGKKGKVYAPEDHINK